MGLYTTISVLSSDFSEIKATVQEAEAAGATMIHWDVMDGLFVPDLTFGAKFIADCRKHTVLPFDTHLMISSPNTKLDPFLENSDTVTFHYEAAPDNAADLISRIHSAGKKAGISVKPSTELHLLQPYLPLLDTVLLMGVEPGRGGQLIDRGIYGRLEILSQMRRSGRLSFQITVDGGVDSDNAAALKGKGADGVVLGTAYLKSPDKKKLIDTVSRI